MSQYKSTPEMARTRYGTDGVDEEENNKQSRPEVEEGEEISA